MTAPGATYRLQLRGPGARPTTFADVEALLDYFGALGVTHLYLSPILTAQSGSTHGYDGTDPTTIAADLGGAAGFTRLAHAARAHGLGLIVDIVPNHLSVAAPEQNRWFDDVLRHGRASRYASFFDIDWTLGDGAVLLPVLDDPADPAGLVVAGDRLRLGALSLPIAPGTAGPDAAAVYARQHYRLVPWRSGRCGYRRFLAINTLAALRQQEPAVFDACHRQVGDWAAEQLIDGLRIDHLDGLADPAGYLHRLRALVGPDCWIVVEKTLAADEQLDPALPVAGTTGYDALRLITGALIDPTGLPALRALSAASAPPPLIELKTRAARVDRDADLDRLRRTVAAAAGADHPLLPAALIATAARIEVARIDDPAAGRDLSAVLAAAERAEPALAPALALIAVATARGGEPTVRLAQFALSVAATAIEARRFYTDATLVAGNELGCDPDRITVSAKEFHAGFTTRAQHWPRAMTALSTHDTLRGEDVRARIGLLAQLPERWAHLVTDWQARLGGPDPGLRLLLWQNIFGVWPADGVLTARWRRRLHDYAIKAAREADGHTGWQRPDAEFEAALHDWLDRVFDGPVAGELTALVAELAPHAAAAALTQKLLSLTVPGVPDLYQGTECWEDSLVDPDNRRPVDFAAARAALAAGEHPKLTLVRAALALRRAHPRDFAGEYRPVWPAGSAAEQLLAFGRGEHVLVAVGRYPLRLAQTGWGDTTLPLPPGRWTDRLGGAEFAGRVRAEQLFATGPVALLERTATD